MKDAHLAENSWDGILIEDEVLLWQGQPVATLGWRDLDIADGLLGVFFAMFAIVWMSIASQGGGLFWMFGLIFLGIGLRKSLGQIVLDPWMRARTYYSLTNKRAFIASHKPVTGRNLQIYTIDPKAELDIEQGATDTVFFGVKQNYGRKGRRFDMRIGFEKLPDGQSAFETLKKIKSGQV